MRRKNRKAVLISQELQQEAQLAIQNSLRAFKHDFKVRVESSQLNTMFEKEIASASPVPVSVEDLELVHSKETNVFRVRLGGLPPPIKSQAEIHANEMLRKSRISTLWNKMTQTYMEETEKALLEKSNVSVEKETEKVLLVRVDKLDSEFYGNVRLNSVLISIDRENSLVHGAKLTLSEGKGLLVRMLYSTQAIPGEPEPVPVWSALQVQQNSWLGRLLGMAGWPNKMVAKFQNYTFVQQQSRELSRLYPSDSCARHIPTCPAWQDR